MSGCDDECVDPECPWFFIHGRRTGRFLGIESILSRTAQGAEPGPPPDSPPPHDDGSER